MLEVDNNNHEYWGQKENFVFAIKRNLMSLLSLCFITFRFFHRFHNSLFGNAISVPLHPVWPSSAPKAGPKYPYEEKKERKLLLLLLLLLHGRRSSRWRGRISTHVVAALACPHLKEPDVADKRDSGRPRQCGKGDQHGGRRSRWQE